MPFQPLCHYLMVCAISASADGTLKLWDLTTGAELVSLAGHRNGIRAVAVASTGDFAISGGGDYYTETSDNALRVWDIEHGRTAPASGPQLSGKCRSHYTRRAECCVYCWSLGRSH